MSSVKWKRPELIAVEPIYRMINDCIDGELAVKNKGAVYLPMPCSDDVSPENKLRYEAYKNRAVFYNVTERTLNGLVGEIFSREPVTEVPTEMGAVIEDVNGENINLIQSSKRACEIVLSTGRCGLFVDYPVVEDGASVYDIKEGRIRPTLTIYEPLKIINWRTRLKGAENLISLVVLEELEEIYEDDFERKTNIQYRVLRLGPSRDNPYFDSETDKDIYTVEIYRMDGSKFLVAESYQPLDFSGAKMTEIPFVFIGSENNDTKIDSAPLYSLAALNIHHYMNSADYEESCYITGQPTPWATGLTQEWIDKVLNGRIALGSRGGIPLPPESSVGILQAEPNSMPFEAMTHKERQMAALGARIVEQSVVQRTATEASLESNVENSILSTVAKNVSDAYTSALNMASNFIGKLQESKYELNSDFDLANMTESERRQIISDWQAGAISRTEMRMNYKYSGMKLLEDEIALQEIESEKDAEMDRQLKISGANQKMKGE
jgi:hypothetical protein